MTRKKLLRVISRLWRHDSIWPRWLFRSLNIFLWANREKLSC